ncbi:HNH endonuclease [Kribbella jiaozuonensis]|uniref:DUF222 domain-containing protein n=1 Tax=Kribbella jiaozuonensis TaxID=2575441 RepID=A0A4U3LW29_9ACTN|nr:HNH endonuclease signature motif containing protein [Kribbella jiaozuonensis]TKK80331.1 DUF222 domain-containing protein [Kribbella jiaozuonensis]
MELVGRPVWSMSGSEMLSTLDQLDALLARLQTQRLEVIAGLDTVGYAEEIGAHDTVQLLAFRYRLDRSEARRDVRLAKALPKYRAVSAGLPDVDQDEATEYLRPAQADAIVSALERVPDTVPIEDIDVAERELVGLARHLSPAELRKAGQRVRDLLDTDGPEPDEHKAYAREALTLSTAPNGVTFRGYLANENAELLRSLIHAGARPHKTTDGDLDPRPRDKRQADALTTALTIAATTMDTTTPSPSTPTPDPTQPGTPPAHQTEGDVTHCPARPTNAPTPGAVATDATQQGMPPSRQSGGNVTDCATRPTNAPAMGAVPTDATQPGTIPSRQTGGDATHCAVRPTDGPGGLVPGFGAKANITVTIDLEDLKSAAAHAIGDTVYGDGLSAATIRRLACDARILPLVLGSNSEPLDVGRSERLVTRAMRRALNARDKGCVVCGAPPIMCDAHHLVSWIDGGETKISNLALLCRRHHIDLHAGDWTITITHGKVSVSRPTWADRPNHATPLDAKTPPDLTSSLHETTTFAIWGNPQPTTPTPPTAPQNHPPHPNPWPDPPPPPPTDPWSDPQTNPAAGPWADPGADSRTDAPVRARTDS